MLNRDLNIPAASGARVDQSVYANRLCTGGLKYHSFILDWRWGPIVLLS